MKLEQRMWGKREPLEERKRMGASSEVLTRYVNRFAEILAILLLFDGGSLQTDHFEALPHLIRVAMVIDFEADVPGGNWVTVGFDSPLVRPPTCIWGEWNGG